MLLVGKLDVDEGGKRLDRGGVLRVIQEVSMAAQKVGIPLEDVKRGPGPTMLAIVGRGYLLVGLGGPSVGGGC